MFSNFRLEVLLSKEGAIFSALAVSSVIKFAWLARVRAARDHMFTLMGHVSELTVYPIKACGGVDLQSALATDVGLFADGYYDRRWMIQSKETGNYLNMKSYPQLSLVTSTVDGDWLIVSAPDMTPLRLPREPDPTKFRNVITNFVVSLSKTSSSMRVLDAGCEANDWMTKFLRHPVRLLFSGPGIGTRDAYDCSFDWETTSRRGDKTVFAYLTAYLLCTTASLADVNSRLDSPVASRNFRPNIVVDNTIAFDEDNWEEIRIGSTARFHYVQPCRRCVITTVNPNTAKYHADNQPLAELRKYRHRAVYSAPLFGAYIAMDCEGHIQVGDPVYAIRKQSAAA